MSAGLSGSTEVFTRNFLPRQTKERLIKLPFEIKIRLRLILVRFSEGLL